VGRNGSKIEATMVDINLLPDEGMSYCEFNDYVLIYGGFNGL